jgi:hypothetical protein
MRKASGSRDRRFVAINWGEYAKRHPPQLCAAAQCAALLRPTNCLTAIAPTEHGL